MTNEQWLVYLWSIYPNGEIMKVWIVILLSFIGLIMLVAILHFEGDGDETTLWSKMGKWKIAIPSILVVFIILSYLVPKRDHFLLIIATPYAVEAGKSLADSLNDPISKLSKLNQMTDKALDKALIYLDADKKDKQLEPKE